MVSASKQEIQVNEPSREKQMDTGQITVNISRICLQFKDPTDAKGQVCVKYKFIGPGAKMFGTSTTSTVESALHNLTMSTVESDLIEVPKKIDSAQSEGNSGQIVQGPTTIINVDLTIQSTKFEINTDNLSKLGTTELSIEIYMRHGSGDSVPAMVIGKATAQIESALAGENEWSDNLLLGTNCFAVRSARDECTFGDVNHRREEESAAGQKGREERELSDDTQDNSIELETSPQGLEEGTRDDSPGLLRQGGSTSTISLKLLTNDDTADYTVGGGSLWVQEAVITGIPDDWKLEPPPGTERSSWNTAIVQMLAAPLRHEYSLWWPDKDKALLGMHGERDTLPFPPMRLEGGILSYAPSDEISEPTSLHDNPSNDSGDGTDSDPRKGAQAEAQNDSDRPSDGRWFVRFPSSRSSHGVFLHRSDIRALRKALVAGKNDKLEHETGGGNGNLGKNRIQAPTTDGDRSPTIISAMSTTLAVFLERREKSNASRSESDQVGTGGKGAKKGKKSADKVAAEQSVLPPEAPWRCSAAIDLGVLIDSPGGERNGQRDTLSSAENCLSRNISPLRAELSAKLTLDPAAEASIAEGQGPSPASSATKNPPSTATDIERSNCPATTDVESRARQLGSCGTTLQLTFALTRPLVKGPSQQETTDVSVSDIFVPKDVGPRKPPRDVQMELRSEIDEFVQKVLAEYAKLFLQPASETTEEHCTVEYREKRLFYALNSGGLYHSFLERLKPRVQRIVRKRFGTVPTDPEESNAFIAELYVHLVEQAAIVLNQRIRNIEAKATPSYITTDGEITLQQRVEHLGILADDAESRDKRLEAAARHDDRIEAATAAATAHPDWRILLACAWEDYARFSLRSQRREPQHDEPGANRSKNLSHAARCLEEALGVYPPASEESLAATALLATIALEQGQLDRASALLGIIRARRLPAPEEGSDGYETDQLATLIPHREHALTCLLNDLMDNQAGARRYLFLAIMASKREGERDVQGAIVADDEPRAPGRTAVRVMHDLCAWLLDVGLPAVARRAFTVAEESDRLAIKKAKERGLPTRTPTTLRESSRRLRCRLILAEDDSAEGTPGPAAEILAQEAVELLPEDPRSWQALAEAFDAQGAAKASDAADAWTTVLHKMESAWNFSKSPVPPLRVYMRLGSLYNSLGRTEDAKTCFLRACRAWRAPGPWLGCGIACLRLEQWEEAEDALHHASRLDCNSPSVWGNIALLLLSLGEDRIEEGDVAFAQALRLGLAEPSLLREIGNCYVASGRLEAAEKALRLSLAAEVDSSRSESNGSSHDNGGVGKGKGRGGGGNPHTRRRLADVLSARNAIAEAIEEYHHVLESPSTEASERQEVLARCGTLLRKMGRAEEMEQLREACWQGMVESHFVMVPDS